MQFYTEIMMQKQRVGIRQVKVFNLSVRLDLLALCYKKQ